MLGASVRCELFRRVLENLNPWVKKQMNKMSNISSVDLEVIRAVAETGSFRKSALRLNMGQPAVSRRIARIEDMIGVSLFERRSSGTRLTVAGNAFLARTRVIIEEIDAAVEEAQSAGKAASGALNIGLIASLSKGAMRELVGIFRDENPNVKFHFTEAERSELLILLTHRKIDLLLASGMSELDACDTVLIDEETIYLATPSNSRLARKQRIEWADVSNETFILSSREPGPEIHDYIVRRASGLAKPVKVARHRLCREGIMGLVSLGLGVSLVADHWRGVSYPNVRFVPIGTKDETVPFSITWRPENDNPALRRFISLARIEAKRNGALS